MSTLNLKAKLRQTIKTDAGYLPKDSYLPPGTSAETVERLLKANRIRLEVAEEDTAPAVGAVHLDSLDYRQLQALAKKRGIPANQSADDLLEALSGVA